jgi:aconitate hydratase
MSQRHVLFDSLKTFSPSAGRSAGYYSLPALETAGLGKISRMPVCLRIVLESVLRNCDGERVHEADVRRLAAWKPTGERTNEIPFVVARILLQDFTGVPVLVDLAAMRSAVARLDKDPGLIEPLVPVDLVVDHSVQVDYWNRPDALALNMEVEAKRNHSRYRFLKWGTKAFNNFNVVPPGVGICHQVNLEYLADVATDAGGLYHPDTVVGTDSHTPMVNGLGVVGWGLGGIEAEAGMLGQPIYFLEPDVIGVHLKGRLKEGATATDLVLLITERLRRYKVVGKFVEFFGEGAATVAVTDRATVGNMAPEYGATLGFWPVDEQTCRYLAATGRDPEHVDAVRNYYTAQRMFGMPRLGEVDYTDVLELDLDDVTPSVSGPRRPQDRIDLPAVKERFHALFQAPVADGGYGKKEADFMRRFHVKIGAAARGPAVVQIEGGGSQDPATVPEEEEPLTSPENTNPVTEEEMMQNRPTPDRVEVEPEDVPQAGMVSLGHGDVVIAAITSCTNTSNPGVMLAAGLLARKAVEYGLTVKPSVKTSLGPGSRVVTDYLKRTGLQKYLDDLGFDVVGYGCTTCIGNSGPLPPSIEDAIRKNDLVVASVLSGNRNFEARIHQSVRANFLMSPPLVVAFALAGRIDIDMTTEPLGNGVDGKPIFLRDLWPTQEELADVMTQAADPETYRTVYGKFDGLNLMWDEIELTGGKSYDWDPASTYIQEPPYFERFSIEPEPIHPIKKARPLAILGDFLTTDHISPAGAISPKSPAAEYLLAHDIPVEDFNTYGARRGNDRVMVRGTFANIRLRNLMAPGTEGGVTVHHPSGEQMSIYAASVRYKDAGVPLVVIAGHEYGSGSSRDWAAKGTRLLGVRAVIAQGFERIHRSNLVQLGVLPCQFPDGVSAKSLGLDGSEQFDLLGIEHCCEPRQQARLSIHRADGTTDEVQLLLRIDTPIEVDYYRHGGILPYMLRRLVGKKPGGRPKPAVESEAAI